MALIHNRRQDNKSALGHSRPVTMLRCIFTLGVFARKRRSESDIHPSVIAVARWGGKRIDVEKRSNPTERDAVVAILAATSEAAPVGRQAQKRPRELHTRSLSSGFPRNLDHHVQLLIVPSGSASHSLGKIATKRLPSDTSPVGVFMLLTALSLNVTTCVSGTGRNKSRG